MTSTLSNPASQVRPSAALTARRWALVAAPVLAGVFTTIGVLADPAAGISGRELYERYAADPGPLQIKSLGLHYGYALLVLPALLVPRLITGRGAWLANVAATLGFLGISTLPGLLFVDYYDSAIGQVYGADGALEVEARMNEMWGVPVFAVPGVLGTGLGIVLAGAALWRAGRAPWWTPLTVVAAIVSFGASNAMWWGAALATVFLTAFAVVLAAASDPARST